MQSPTLRQLEYIVAVADTGRFIRAAKQCGVSQPALSKQVREVRVGQGFVVRSFGQTPPGRTLTLQWRDTLPHADWFRDIGVILQQHYLGLNATCPDVAGPSPMIRAVER